MSDGISFFNNDELEINVKKVMSQTNYTKEEAIEKLKLFNCDYMRVLRDYMGLPEKTDDKQNQKVKSVNQEIYRQIRTRLDSTMREYREKNPINMEQVISSFQESEEREKTKLLK